MHRIPIEKCDEMYDPECKGDVFMPFTRANYDKNTGQSPNSPREQVRKIMIFREINLTKIFVKLIFNEKTTMYYNAYGVYFWYCNAEANRFLTHNIDSRHVCSLVIKKCCQALVQSVF